MCHISNRKNETNLHLNYPRKKYRFLSISYNIDLLRTLSELETMFIPLTRFLVINNLKEYIIFRISYYER